jgi:alkylation response protein AidB-like acyl-CoA dehydrogenase
VAGSSACSADGVKYQVFFDDVRVHEKYLIGGDHDGWRAASATLEVEHGAMGGGGHADERFYSGVERSYIFDRFLDVCRNDPNIRQHIEENPEIESAMVDAYIDAEKERLYMIRNMGGKGGFYGGTQSQLFQKMSSIRFISALAKVLGPYTFTSDEEWSPEQSLFEVGHRGALCLAPTGTPEVLKIVIARALSIGR